MKCNEFQDLRDLNCSEINPISELPSYPIKYNLYQVNDAQYKVPCLNVTQQPAHNSSLDCDCDFEISQICIFIQEVTVVLC